MAITFTQALVIALIGALIPAGAILLVAFMNIRVLEHIQRIEHKTDMVGRTADSIDRAVNSQPPGTTSIRENVQELRDRSDDTGLTPE